MNDSSRIDIAGDNVSAGHLLSLVWYSIYHSVREKPVFGQKEAKAKKTVIIVLIW